MADGTPRRSWVKLDRFALADIGREHRLSPNASLLFLWLCLLADFRDMTYTGTALDLSWHSRIGRDTIPKALVELEKAGLIAVVVPFGRNRSGTVEVTAYDDLVVGATGRGMAHRRDPTEHAEDPAYKHDVDMPTICGPYAGNLSDVPHVTSGNADLLRDLGEGVMGSADSVRAVSNSAEDEKNDKGFKSTRKIRGDDICRDCGDPAGTMPGWCPRCEPY